MNDILNILSSFIIPCVWILIIVSAIKRAQKNSKNRGSINKPPTKQQMPDRSINNTTIKRNIPVNNIQKPVAVPKPTHRISARLDNSLEDRNSDWLSQQKQEEKVSMFNMSEMFGLKINHMNNCDAEALRREHIKVHETHGIDSGTGQKTR